MRLAFCRLLRTILFGRTSGVDVRGEIVAEVERHRRLAEDSHAARKAAECGVAGVELMARRALARLEKLKRASERRQRDET